MSTTIKRITIEGFKSIRKLDFELLPLNVLIGANGAGKSNFISFFRLLREMVAQRLQLTLQTTEGGADACLFLGPKVTDRLFGKLYFGQGSYQFSLLPTVDNRMVFGEETALASTGPSQYSEVFQPGHAESRLKTLEAWWSKWEEGLVAPRLVYEAISNWVVYHFHDTSQTSSLRRQRPLNEDEFLRSDAGNLAAYLFRLRRSNEAIYIAIRDVVRLAAPFFDDFYLRPLPTNPDLIQLEWRQKNSDYPFLPHQLSDGTLRFICLATALLQPDRPATVLFDEPELGLHPYALTLLGNLFKQGTTNEKQLIISTQSALLLNEFDPEDVVVVERHEAESTFRRLQSADLTSWLEEYSLGELWQKNVIGGRPGIHETVPH